MPKSITIAVNPGSILELEAFRACGQEFTDEAINECLRREFAACIRRGFADRKTEGLGSSAVSPSGK